MPSDEEILIARMREWHDRDSCPHPMHQPIAPPALMRPYGKQPSDAQPPKTEPKIETWRDRPPLI